MNSNKNISGRRWGVIVLYVLTILMNIISQIIPFNGQTNGEVSDMYPTLITPADYAFSIWGLIFLALGVYAYYQAFRASPQEKLYDEIAPWLMVALGATSAWLPAFQYEMIALSVLIMLIILGSLVQVSIMLTENRSLEKRTKAWLRVPFGLYLGWISVATIVNISVWVKYSDWYLLGWSEIIWLQVMATVGFVLAVIISSSTRNLVFALVFVWAYVAIAVKNYYNNTILQYVLGAAIVLLIVVLGMLLKQFRRKKVMV
ncbi:MAG: TspO/MBR family protein [Cyclobacteriaceae bacterium]